MSAPAGIKTPIRYRAHIDGLRGISIIAMIFYHAKFFGMTGGFIGVDIFFVISGFLITSIIVRDLKAGTFSLVGFWERRIRRIVPPLLIVMLFTAIAGYFVVLYPQDYHHLGNSIIAQSVFASNILFTLTNNYFDQTSRYSPLLHTWTLSVEEQFYLLYPFLILMCVYLARRWSKKRDSASSSWVRIGLPIIAVLGLASFFLSVWFIDLFPSHGFDLPFVRTGVFWQTSFATAGFYLLPTRAWEIAVGIVFALMAWKVRSKGLAEMMSFAGILLIGEAVFLLNDSMPYPGVFALLPTLGTLLIIAANERHETVTGRLLSYPPLVGIGLISYALYLWYWPLFVFGDVLTLFSRTALQSAILIVVSVVLAWLSYRFVETPIRKKIVFKTARSAYVFGVGSMALLMIIGLGMQRTAFAQTSRISPAAQKILQAVGKDDDRSDACFTSSNDTGTYKGLCRIGEKKIEAKPDFIEWGDSHADAVVPVLNALGKKTGVQGAIFDSGACMPIMSVHQSPPATGCADKKTQALAYIESHDIKHIFLVARWTYYVMGGPDRVRVAYITDSDQASNSPEEARQVFVRNLAPMVQRFIDEGRHVYILKQVPEQFHYDTRRAFYMAARTGVVTIPGIKTVENAAYQASVNAVIDGLSVIPGVRVLDPTPLFCMPGGSCPLELHGKVLFRDENHISTAGAMQMEPLFSGIFKHISAAKK